MIERGLTGSSITRIFGTVRAVLNFTASEVGVTMNNPFNGVYYDRQSGVKDRAPLPIDVLRLVQQECMKVGRQPCPIKIQNRGANGRTDHRLKEVNVSGK